MSLRNTFFKTVFLFLCIAQSLIANAYTIDEYKEQIKEGGNSKAFMEMYVMGVGQGFNWASGVSRKNKEKEIFCPPNNLKINGALILSIVNDGFETTKLKGTSPLELYVLQRLTFVFPCK